MAAARLVACPSAQFGIVDQANTGHRSDCVRERRGAGDDEHVAERFEGGRDRVFDDRASVACDEQLVAGAGEACCRRPAASTTASTFLTGSTSCGSAIGPVCATAGQRDGSVRRCVAGFSRNVDSSIAV